MTAVVASCHSVSAEQAVATRSHICSRSAAFDWRGVSAGPTPGPPDDSAVWSAAAGGDFAVGGAVAGVSLAELLMDLAVGAGGGIEVSDYCGTAAVCLWPRRILTWLRAWVWTAAGP